MKTENKVTALALEWQYLIAKDHHKDRDCHFEIIKRWSYGEKPYYTVSHDGYIIDERYIQFPKRATLEEAEHDLQEFLEDHIARWKHDMV